MHFPETVASIVTAADVVSANPEVHASHFTEAWAGKVWKMKKKLKRAIRGFFIVEV